MHDIERAAVGSDGEALTTCRICAGKCALRLALDAQGRIVGARGDRSDPLTRGYACSKGLHLHEAHYSPARLHKALKRTEDGFQEIALETALDEIADRMGAIVRQSGASAVGVFKGTMAYVNFLANQMMRAFMRALGSPAFYSTMTIDQSAKWVTFDRLGGWDAGKDAFELADVLLMIGTNPLVSLSTFNFALQNPVRQMRQAKARGMKLIVIDPRRTETARHADVFLQSLPGEDAVVLAGLLHIVLERNWIDHAFCESCADGLGQLRAAVLPFTPGYVSARAGVPEADLVTAATLFAEPFADGRRKRGSAASGVGPNMARHSNLAEHLVECLNVVCGRFARPGDRVPNPGVLSARRPRMARVLVPQRGFEKAEGRGPGGFGLLFGERMSGALPDDILTDAPGRLRALIVDGGNPAIALPESRRAAEALSALDLLVTIDPFLTPTARLSHYVIPPRMMLERADVGDRDYESIVTFVPYGRYCPPVIAPPPGSATVDDWVVFWELARRLRLPIEIGGHHPDLDSRPDSETLIAQLLNGSAVPFETLKQTQEGRIFETEPMFVQECAPNAAGKFTLAPADVVTGLAALLDEPPPPPHYTHRFAGRRLRDVQNTMYHHLPSIRSRTPVNLAYLHPDDLAVLGVRSGECVAVISAHGRLEASAEPDATLRPGVVSMAHGWGGLPGETGAEPGVNTNLLTSAVRDRDPLNAMPVMTGFPVRVERAAGAALASITPDGWGPAAERRSSPP